MAEKKPRRRDIVAKAKSDLPDVYDAWSSVGSEELSQEDDLMLRACQDERSFRSSLKDTPFLDRLVDSRIDFVYGELGEIHTSSSFRFDVGNGFVLDYRSMGVPSSELAVSILETVLSLVPLMKDGAEIEVDNHDPGIRYACDGFKTRPPGNTYAGSDTLIFEYSREEVDEFDGMPVHRIRYIYDGPGEDEYDGPGEAGNDAHEEAGDETPYFGLRPVFYAVKYGDIHVLFPSRPSGADLEWVSGIRPFLESLTQVLPTGFRSPYTHFVLWRDGTEPPSGKTA